MNTERVRSIAIVILRRGREILAAEGTHDDGQRWYRPLGGTIEFGEHGHETVVRELQEEIDAAIRNVRYLGTLENLFTFRGERGHEIVRIYEAEFADPSLYERNEFDAHEDDGSPFRATWVDLGAVRSGRETLYPDELLGLLDGNRSR